MLVVLFFLVVGLLASAVAIVEILTSTQDHREAMRTGEVRWLYLFNVLIAIGLAYTLTTTGWFSIGIVSAIAFILGYPVLLHSKVFHYKDTSWGAEELYNRVSNMLVPGIDDSIDERGTAYLAEFREQLTTRQLVPHSKDYLRIKLPKADLPDERKDTLLPLMDRLLADSEATPARQGENNTLIFQTLHEIGGYRAVRHIKKVAKKDAP